MCNTSRVTPQYLHRMKELIFVYKQVVLLHNGGLTAHVFYQEKFEKELRQFTEQQAVHSINYPIPVWHVRLRSSGIDVDCRETVGRLEVDIGEIRHIRRRIRGLRPRGRICRNYRCLIGMWIGSDIGGTIWFG